MDLSRCGRLPRGRPRRKRGALAEWAIPLVLGIDIGGTKIASALGDGSGAILADTRRPTEASGDAAADLARLGRELKQLLAEAGHAAEAVDAVGVSLPGPVDLERGRLLNPPNLPGWHDAPVRDALQEALGCPVFLENDANAAALAEWHFGAARGSQHAVYLTMSTGVGGGLILGGRLHRGVACMAGEVGHLPLEEGGELCGCGLRGCAEAYLGGANWARRLARSTPADSRVAALAGGVAQARPEHVVQAAREGDAFALAELDRFNDYLARTLAILGFVLAPEVVVLGTIAVAAGEELCFGPLRERLATRLWPPLLRGMRVVPAALGPKLPDYAGLGVAFDGLGHTLP